MAEHGLVVVGGGLAGITAALRAADGGRSVTLVEGRPRLGGAAFSFRRGELSVDNGQHVFLRCCAAYRWLLDRIGAADRVVLQDRLDIPVLGPRGRHGRLRRTPGVPAPGHLSASLATYKLLGPLDKMRAARGALALRLLDPADPNLDARSLGEFLRAHGQSPAVIDSLWGIVATATLNAQPDDASLALAAKVFRTGMLDHASAADVGYAAVPLGELHDSCARRALDSAGVEVLTAHRVSEIVDAGDGPLIHVNGRTDARQLRPDAVILALPPRELFRVAPTLEHSAAAPARGLGTSPIVNVHVVYDRPVTDLAFAAGVDSPVQWFFDRTDSSDVRRTHPRAQYLAVTVSAADDLIDTPSGELQQRFVAALAELLPGARRAEVLDAFVTRERHATFRQEPGSAALRPGPDSGKDGIWLAGSWTATGWPDTMESAVRSGVAAAEAALKIAPQRVTRFAA